MATSPVHSRGPKRGQNCYIIPAFSGIPNAKRGEKIRSGYLTLAFSGAQKRAELLRNPCILGNPQRQRGQKIRSGYLTLAFSGAQKRAELLRNPCILGNPKRQARGQNQKCLPHPRILRGPKRGRNCYVTPTFSGIPDAKRGVKNQKWLPHPCLLGGPKEGGIAT